jgi:signal transduction histidine kinase
VTGLGGGGRLVVGVGGLVSGVAAGAALLLGGYDVAPELVAPTLVLNLAVGWSFIGVGLIAWSRRPDNRTGVLMVLLGFAWLLRIAGAVAQPAWFVFGFVTSSLYLGVLAHLLVTFATGGITTPAQRALVVIGYLLTVPTTVLLLVLVARSGSCWDCPRNLVVVSRSSGSAVVLLRISVVGLVVTILLTATLLAVVLTQWWRAGRAQRRSMGPAVVGAVTILGTLVVQRIGVLLDFPPALSAGLAWSSQVVLVVWPLALLFGVLRSRLDRSAVSSMIVELGAGLAPDRLEVVLARTLHDPSLRLAFWLPEREAFVDSRGAPVALTPTSAGRALTYLDRDGARLAVLLHDAALAEDPELVSAVAAGAGMAVENERLHAEVRAQLRDVRESRARIVDAADAARRRVERDLHDGAQQRLVTVALALKLAGRRLGSAPAEEIAALLQETGDELLGALDELRELARGIYPVLLTDAGLGPAVIALAERSPIPAVVSTAPAERLPGPVEQTGYFVVSEALANAAKHSAAGRVAIDLQAGGGALIVEVSDDGVGGADANGSGLRGLADRVAAAGGSLRLTSPPGGGTQLIAELPMGLPVARP